MYKIKDILNTILNGDSLVELQKIPSDSINLIVTSPPYFGLRDYQVEGQLGIESTLEEFLDKLLAITSELKRVLSPTGTMYWNHGNSYVSSGTQRFDKPGTNKGLSKIHCGRTKTDEFPATCLSMQNYRLILKMIDEQGFILRDIIIWKKENPMPSSIKTRRNFVYEPVFMLVKSNKANYYYNDKTGLMTNRKPTKLVEGIDWDWKKEEVIPESVSKYAKGSDFNKKYGEPWDRFGKNTKKAGKIPAERAEEFGSPRARVHRESKRKKISYWHGLTYWFDLEAIRVPHKESSIKRATYPINPYGDQGTGSKAKMTGSVKGSGERKMITMPEGGKNPGNILSIPTQSLPYKHFASSPEALCRPLILSSCPKEVCRVCGKPRIRIVKPTEEYAKLLGKDWNPNPYNKRMERGHCTKKSKSSTTAQYRTVGWTECSCSEKDKYRSGIVMDPFMGAATTGVVAKKLGRDYIGIELSKDYIEIAQERLNSVTRPLL